MASSALKTAAVSTARVAFNGLYRLFELFGRRDEVLFVSRKSGEPSYDYVECGKAFSAQGYEPVYLSQHFKRSSVLAYAGLVLRELYHLARCRVCVIDRYDPVISLLDFTCEPTELRDALHLEFPSEPIVIQLWHAFGAFKKFGYQALDIAEGHPSDEAALFRIHRNNSWVICSGEGARKAFAEAFACPIERVLPLGRPEYRKLCDMRGAVYAARAGKSGVAGARRTVLFAPTIRKYDKVVDPFADLCDTADQVFQSNKYDVVWSANPLTAGKDAGGDVPTNLIDADIVITDYSSIVYEAYLLGKMVGFYAPDIAHYRLSPGLNADPMLLCPGITASSPRELADLLEQWSTNRDAYPLDELERFIGDSFIGCSSNPAEAIASFAITRAEER